MSWIEINLNVPQEALEEISGYLFALGCEGIQVTEKSIIIYFTQHRWSNEVKIGLLEFIGQIIPHFSMRDIQIKALADQDWMQGWKEYFKAIRVTNRIIIKPPWEDYKAQEGEEVVIINPQMAFGTGNHESTQLMIRAIDKFIQPSMHVLDVGTGSGILALVCVKLGADSVLGIDNDINALKNAGENARLNKSSDKIRFIFGQLEQFHPMEYDLVLANINAKVLLEYNTLFPSFMKLKSKLIISGILRSDEQKIVDPFHNRGFKLVHKNAIKEWLSLVFELDKKEETQEKSGLGYMGY
jgi:ribosomal protein L11 methyltransferase